MHTPAQATSGTYRRGGKKTIFLFLSLISHSEKDNKKRKEEKWAWILYVCVCVCMFVHAHSSCLQAKSSQREKPTHGPSISS